MGVGLWSVRDPELLGESDTVSYKTGLRNFIHIYAQKFIHIYAVKFYSSLRMEVLIHLIQQVISL